MPSFVPNGRTLPDSWEIVKMGCSWTFAEGEVYRVHLLVEFKRSGGVVEKRGVAVSFRDIELQAEDVVKDEEPAITRRRVFQEELAVKAGAATVEDKAWAQVRLKTVVESAWYKGVHP
jgi:hypothetical protein